MTYPRYFYMARKEEKLFKAEYTDRHSGKGALLKLFTDLVEGSDRDVAACNIKVTILQSDEEVGLGKPSCGLGRGFLSSRNTCLRFSSSWVQADPINYGRLARSQVAAAPLPQSEKPLLPITRRSQYRYAKVNLPSIRRCWCLLPVRLSLQSRSQGLYP
jgi:hypothetical protein